MQSVGNPEAVAAIAKRPTRQSWMADYLLGKPVHRDGAVSIDAGVEVQRYRIREELASA